ncbi:hypothetical protein P43SY_011952 [Pythium insidiosum]|uniref:Uncharacterized protein n=1 Tax=Pythium insidiosum TaxID=114742 RepID=A0AAD5Q2V2_PYTIN|nr:hypothetical protein P43SY_011952 [Pythium insidiosum]
MNEIGFHSVFFLSKSRDTITKIERLQSSVFGRHSDISPNIELPSKSTRSFPQVFANPFQRLSVALASDNTRGSMVSVPRTSAGRHITRAMDKITPLSRDDDFGDSATFDRSAAPTTLDLKAALADSTAPTTSHPAYSELLASLADGSERTTPVVFVTPRDLSERDFLTYIQNKDVFFVRGSPVSMRVFEDARMFYARGILILAYCGGGQIEQRADGADFDENMSDI